MHFLYYTNTDANCNIDNNALYLSIYATVQSVGTVRFFFKINDFI